MPFARPGREVPMNAMQRKIAIAALLLMCSPTLMAADVVAGRAAAQAKCVQCHEADDWDGESAASLESIMRDILAGKVKHKTKLDLTPAEIANIAAYWATGKK
jgi:mono/diheme cytochrome c family protein